MELRHLRETAGLTLDQVADTLHCSESKISRIETGRVSARRQDVQEMLDLYGIKGKQQAVLVQIADETRVKGWWHTYHDTAVGKFIGFEAAATSIRTFEALLIPGLLQTPEYAGAVLRAVQPELAPGEIERRVGIRMARQAHVILEDPPAMWAIIDEAAIRRIVGGVTVMRGQLQRLIQVAESPTLTLQILPFASGEHAGMDGSFTIHGFSEPAEPATIYLLNAMSDYHLEGEEAVRRYSLLFDHLLTAALAPDDSVTFLTGIVKEL